MKHRFINTNSLRNIDGLNRESFRERQLRNGQSSSVVDLRKTALVKKRPPFLNHNLTNQRREAARVFSPNFQTIPKREESFDDKKNIKRTQNSGGLIKEAFTPRLRKAFFYSFAVALIFIILSFSLMIFKGIKEKKDIEKYGLEGYNSFKEAGESMQEADIYKAGRNFDKSYNSFLMARKKLEEVGGLTSKIFGFIPGVSQVESGKKMARVGENLAFAGKELTDVAIFLFSHEKELKETLAISQTKETSQGDMTLTKMILETQSKLDNVILNIEQAGNEIQDVKENDFPASQRNQVVVLKQTLPEISKSLKDFRQYADVFLELLGQNGSRKYMLLFQNNEEMRATGGFIGSYGLVKVNEGQVEQIKVNGIYDPDGQLKEKIIPPKPIQKMSAAWSLHDANWWPNFPTSAQKISWFWEKTGGPSIDGVIALTPEVIIDLITVTGPIEVEGYGNEGNIVVDKDNFREIIQYEVEEGYDKEKNNPKEILSDITPKLLQKIFSTSSDKWPQIFNVFSKALKERQMIFYSVNPDIQRLISGLGWSGEILKSPKDYLSVVNTNISGYKTDGVIEQKITHQAEVQEDGIIVDTLTIEREHKGGNEEFDWYNKVNSDWLRVYVPKGSKLISAKGFTKEFIEAPLDYQKLEFKEDDLVKEMENSYEIDSQSATRIYEEEGKTVFANWVYTSPGETAKVVYKYLLPFKINASGGGKVADTYSLLIQKQSGDNKTNVDLNLTGLEDYEYVYKYPDDLNIVTNGWHIEKELDEDGFFALVIK